LFVFIVSLLDVLRFVKDKRFDIISLPAIRDPLPDKIIGGSTVPYFV